MGHLQHLIHPPPGRLVSVRRGNGSDAPTRISPDQKHPPSPAGSSLLGIGGIHSRRLCSLHRGDLLGPFLVSNALAAMPDPNRPGRTLQNIPNLFDQRVYDASLMLPVARNVNASADYAYEKWTSHYTAPTLDRRTFSQGLGLSYDLPWGGSKFEVRYKHVKFRDAYVLANNYNADQVCAFLDFKF